MFPFATPVDHALPFVIALMIAIAMLCRRRAAILLFSIPLLVACAICFPDEHVRLLGYGVVVAAAFCGASFAIEEWTFANCAGLTLVGIALLRWIARDHVEIWRETVIALGALLIVAVIRKSPLAVTIALAAAFVTPGVPTRTLLIPFAVATVVAIFTLLTRPSATLSRRERGETLHHAHLPLPTGEGGRRPGEGRASRPELGVVPAFVMLVLFPWSGVSARAIPYFFRATRATPAQRLAPLNFALKAGEAIEIDVPSDATSIAVSAANGFRLKRDTFVGTLDGRPLTMRDLADWGFMRREQWWRSSNRLPRVPAGIIRGYGYDAWVDGAGRVAVPAHARRIRVVADPHLPPNARLQVEAFER
ncbi:MAG TPA: hypothetical protein VGJ81_02400 [Thermoanaerobaculia bacterium]